MNDRSGGLPNRLGSIAGCDDRRGLPPMALPWRPGKLDGADGVPLEDDPLRSQLEVVREDLHLPR